MIRIRKLRHWVPKMHDLSIRQRSPHTERPRCEMQYEERQRGRMMAARSIDLLRRPQEWQLEETAGLLVVMGEAVVVAKAGNVDEESAHHKSKIQRTAHLQRRPK